MVLLRAENSKWSLPLLKLDRYILALSVLGFSGIIFYNLSLLYIPVTQASLFGVLTPVISVITASLMYKERLTTKQYLGIVMILVALTLINLN